MAIIRSYAIWNNKGGVGKSTIAFHISSRYAEKKKKAKVLVIDLCPQANSSMMLLGGGTSGESNVLSFCTAATPKTVVGYLSTVISQGSGATLPNPFDYIVKVKDYNAEMPDNLFLLCGDGNLEPMAPAITAAADAKSLTPANKPWLWVHRVFAELVENVGRLENDSDWMVFIDTNPSFSIYTELAVSSADRLIAPVNADDSSRVAANAMFILLHGQNPPHPIYGSWTFAARAKEHGLTIPRIHIIVGNRLTQYEGAATAFSALSNATADALFAAYKSHPGYFTEREIEIKTMKDFRDKYSVALRDFNTAGVVSSHLGKPLSKMVQGYHNVYGFKVKVNAQRISECADALDNVLSQIL